MSDSEGFKVEVIDDKFSYGFSKTITPEGYTNKLFIISLEHANMNKSNQCLDPRLYSQPPQSNRPAQARGCLKPCPPRPQQDDSLSFSPLRPGMMTPPPPPPRARHFQPPPAQNYGLDARYLDRPPSQRVGFVPGCPSPSTARPQRIRSPQECPPNQGLDPAYLQPATRSPQPCQGLDDKYLRASSPSPRRGLDSRYLQSASECSAASGLSSSGSIGLSSSGSLGPSSRQGLNSQYLRAASRDRSDVSDISFSQPCATSTREGLDPQYLQPAAPSPRQGLDPKYLQPAAPSPRQGLDPKYLRPATPQCPRPRRRGLDPQYLQPVPISPIRGKEHDFLIPAPALYRDKTPLAESTRIDQMDCAKGSTESFADDSEIMVVDGPKTCSWKLAVQFAPKKTNDAVSYDLANLLTSELDIGDSKKPSQDSNYENFQPTAKSSPIQK